jgi:hypothetical protein
MVNSTYELDYDPKLINMIAFKAGGFHPILSDRLNFFVRTLFRVYVFELLVEIIVMGKNIFLLINVLEEPPEYRH